MAHGRLDFLVFEGDDAGGVLEDDRKRRGVRRAAGHTVGHGVRAVGRDRPARLETQRVTGRLLRDHADDLRPEPQRLARGNRAADTGAEPDGHIERVQMRDGAEKLVAAGRHPGHERGMEGRQEMQAFAFGQRAGMLERVLEVAAMHHEVGPESAHGGILFTAVALRHDNRDPLARLPGGIGDGLPVIAARRRHHAVRFALRHIGEPAANLEGADGRVVLVLDPDLGPGPLSQQRPDPLRGRRERGVNEFGRRLDFSLSGQCHGSSFPGSVMAVRWSR